MKKNVRHTLHSAHRTGSGQAPVPAAPLEPDARPAKPEQADGKLGAGRTGQAGGTGKSGWSLACLSLVAALIPAVILAPAGGLWRAHAQEEPSLAAKMLEGAKALPAQQRPSAFRQLITGTQQPAPVPAGKTAQNGRVRLFNTVEFKGPLKLVPQWSRVMQAMKAGKGKLSAVLPATGNGNARAAWKTLRDSAAKDPLMEKLKKVNAFFNKYPYRLDQEVWGKTDYWATPAEFAEKSGDCEDYAISKYYALREMGIEADKLRIVALRDRIRGIGHAVLVVYAEGTAWVLDNQTDLVLSHDRYSHYQPQYSVNEHNRWAHVPAR